jgi:hypothetical protein
MLAMILLQPVNYELREPPLSINTYLYFPGR